MIELSVRYHVERGAGGIAYSWLCFKHAVLIAENGREVLTEIDNYRSEQWMGPTACVICYPPASRVTRP